jgi:hypothetical protein
LIAKIQENTFYDLYLEDVLATNDQPTNRLPLVGLLGKALEKREESMSSKGPSHPEHPAHPHHGKHSELRTHHQHADDITNNLAGALDSVELMSLNSRGKSITPDEGRQVTTELFKALKGISEAIQKASSKGPAP